MAESYGQFCPIAVACEVFAERWTPIILRELLAGSQHFSELRRGIPLISSALLARRLRSLETHGVLARERDGAKIRYRLTDAGREFQSAIDALGAWGQRWTVRVDRRRLDAGLLMWNVRRRIARERLPPRRVVVQFGYSGVPARLRGPRRFWLLLARESVDLCVEDPGFEVDLVVAADLAAMTRVWLGDLSYADARDARLIRIDGSATLARAFPSWLMLSRFASVERPAAQDRDAAGGQPRRRALTG